MKEGVRLLASLLPGLRELRAPLAAGYIWLVGLWLSLHNLVAASDYSTGAYGDIVNLGEWAGKPAIFAASALAAYLIGILSTAATNILNIATGWATYTLGRGRLEWLKPARMARVNVGSTLYDAVVNRLCRRFLEDQTFREAAIRHATKLQLAHGRRGTAFTSSRLPDVLEFEHGERLKQRAEEHYLTRWNLLSNIVDTDPYVDAAEQDLEYVAPRLIGKEDIVYGEYDRLMAEGNFRINMFLPMCYLFGSLAVTASPWWALGFMAPVALVYLGSYSRGLARQHLVVALAAERVEGPALDRLMKAQIEFASYEEVVVT